jgi:hypothetical protein
MRLPIELDQLRSAADAISSETAEVSISSNTRSLDKYLNEIVGLAAVFNTHLQLKLSLVGAISNLDFLADFPLLRRLEVLSGRIRRDGLKYVPKLGQSDAPWHGNASRHVDWANYRSSRCARSRYSGEDATTTRLPLGTPGNPRHLAAHLD